MRCWSYCSRVWTSDRARAGARLLAGLVVGLAVCWPAEAVALVVSDTTGGEAVPRVVGTVRSAGEPVPYAEVGVKGLTSRAIANERGQYVLTGLRPGSYTLLVTAVGFGTAEVVVDLGTADTLFRDVELEQRAIGLNPIVVTATRKRTFVSESPVKVDVVPSVFLETMASSNLLESIQHVNGLYVQNDCAVCYTNNIRINGMEGPYTSVLIDGQPIVSALGSVYGLNGINPALIERIEIIKGPNSTLYGSSAMAGVINVITKDPRFAPRVSVDVQRTDHGLTSVDFALAPSAGPVSALLSGSYIRQGEFLDDNGDNYADLSLDRRLTVFGKVHVAAERGNGLSVVGKYYNEDRFGGVREWTPEYRGSSEVYGESIYTERFELLGNWGLPLADEDVRLEFSAVHHDQDAAYGDTPYNAQQWTLVWDKTVGLRNDLLLGLGADYQGFDDESPATPEPVTSVTPGVFVQNEYSAGGGLKVLGGMRLDHHENHGWITSPRLALKLDAFEATTFRLNAGTGFRVVDLFTEDYATLMHQRRLAVADDLDPERSYNVTLNANQVLRFGNNPMMVDLDVFYTYFTNRIIPDYDSDPTRIEYHNIDGYGVTQGVGISLNQNLTALPLHYTLGLTVQDVFFVDGGVREEEVYSADYKGTWSATYRLEDLDLDLDYAGTLVGPMRLPAYDAPFERPTRSETYTVHNLIGTWKGLDNVELYAGVKNLFDFTQPSPIVDPGNPFGDHFDTAWVYGPIYGRSLLVGGRYVLGR
ncbi:MAG: TonB-dependent receptor [Gemmatimonadota bacterium]